MRKEGSDEEADDLASVAFYSCLLVCLCVVRSLDLKLL